VAKSSASPRSQQRLRVFDAYRGRGRRTNDLWLVYSVKTNRDWILSSNRQLVHWLVFLETEPSVKSFDFETTERERSDETTVAVLLANGSKEQHLVIAERTESQDGAHSWESEGRPEGRRIYSDIELRPQVQLAMRWFKAIAFAAALRDKEYVQLRLALIPLLRSVKGGVIGQVVEELSGFEESSVFGMLVRLAIEGHVRIDLSAFGFCSFTRWAWREGHNVDA
jgi:hypothetical protein